MSYNCSHISSNVSTECGDGKDYALAKFARNVSTVDYDTLKTMLKEYEKAEYYEYCDVIQKEIDFRVELASKGWK